MTINPQVEALYTGSVTVMYRCCKACEKANGGKVAKRVALRTRKHKGAPDVFGNQRTTAIDFLAPDGVEYRHYAPHQVPYLPCERCGRPMAGKPLHGQHNPAVPCDRRCTGAIGHNCECSCGGRNHGMDWS